jgi:hypothetical protein
MQAGNKCFGFLEAENVSNTYFAIVGKSAPLL